MTPQEQVMLMDLQDSDAEMTDWEKTFISDISDRFEENDKYRLTDGQFDKLQELWERYCDD